MHSVKINDVFFNYHGDFKGDVVIVRGGNGVVVDAEELVEFVLDRLREQLVAKLEGMDREELTKTILTT